jgi:uncharacterized protein YegL
MNKHPKGLEHQPKIQTGKKQTTQEAVKESKRILVNLLLDETGSMASCLHETISGFNEYLKSLQEISKKKKVLFSLTKFNSEKVETVYTAVNIDRVKELSQSNYQPNHLTPLYDAIGKTVSEVDSKIKNYKNMKILVVIMTDGEENHSKEYTHTQIFDMIKKHEELGWTFIFLGADIDSFAIGHKLGLHVGNVINLSHTNMRAGYDVLSHATGNYAFARSINTANFFMGAKDVSDYDTTTGNKKKTTTGVA